MKGSLVAIDEIGGRIAAAKLVNGRLHDFLIDPPEGVLVPGTILWARADRPLKGQGAMLMSLPGGASAFLREAAGLKPGDRVPVQVTGYPEGDKAVPVTTKLLFKGRYAIVTPDAPGLNLSRQIKDDEARARLHDVATEAMQGSTHGLIVRSAAAEADDAEISADIASLLAQAAEALAAKDGVALPGPGAAELARREWFADAGDTEPGSFDRHGVHDLLAALASDRVDLSGGAHAFIEPTRALIAVDVNTGADTSPAAGHKANLALARELPRQLLMRGLGGQIVIDFAPMPKKERAGLESTLRTALKADPVETSLVGWTTLGHYELQRKRERLPVNFVDLT